MFNVRVRSVEKKSSHVHVVYGILLVFIGVLIYSTYVLSGVIATIVYNALYWQAYN